MKTINTLRLFVITMIAMMATTAFAQDALPVTLNFRSEGGTQSINIAESNVNWKLTCDAPWVHLTPAEGKGAAEVTLVVNANKPKSAK